MDNGFKVRDRIFLSYESEDKSKAIEIYQKLQVAGFNPWLDKVDLLPGQKWNTYEEEFNIVF